jgi:acyl transferase domain-containing protein
MLLLIRKKDGCGIVVVKILIDGKNDDIILAVIQGSAVNHDRASRGLTVPSVIRQALDCSKVKAKDISFVELDH